MRFVTASPASIKRAAAIIREGGLVAFPTETVYGLGSDALNPMAVAKIFEVKNRPSFDPIIVHIDKTTWMKKLCTSMDERAKKLMKKFWPGPLTIVLPKTELVPDIVTAGLPTVAVRMPAHSVALKLIKEAKTPIAAPSANPFGYLSPTTANHVREQLGDKVDLILDGGKCPIGVESTVIDLTGAEPALLRPGGLPVEEIEKIIGDVRRYSKKRLRPISPGLLRTHYSPRTPLKILEKVPKVKANERAGLLAFTPLSLRKPYEIVEVLSPTGDLREAAARLFSCLHELDKAGLDVIYAEPVPEVGLGRAIMDRLYRAASGEK